jgi:(p)ppGpp synthase/HD superfamily hydrolase
MPDRPPLLSPRFEQAVCLAAEAHAAQVRRGSGVPAIAHLVAVAWILERAGFDEDVVIAGLLHDVVEDTPTSLDELRARFGPAVAALVAHSSEVKTDEQGRKRPWIDRKRDHLAALAGAPVEARAVVLADKLHNLLSIRADLEAGRPIWSLFHADRESVLWYYAAMIAACESSDSRLGQLADQCRDILTAIEALGPIPSRAVPQD